MAATNLLALVFFSQLILLFTLTSRPCVGNGDGTCLSVMAAGFGVPIPLTRRLLSVGFARSRFPVSKSSKHGLTSLLIPGHDPPVDITIFIDVPKNTGPYASTCSRQLQRFIERFIEKPCLQRKFTYSPDSSFTTIL